MIYFIQYLGATFPKRVSRASYKSFMRIMNLRGKESVRVRKSIIDSTPITCVIVGERHNG
jgi:hypothetical protein